jgi:bifunctional polynucleotide phosphatase/kinase
MANKRTIDDFFGGKESKKLRMLGNWSSIETTQIYQTLNFQMKPWVYGFDLDSTLVVTSSGKRFSKDAKDWKFAYPNVRSHLHKLCSEENACFVIFSNQGGIGQKKVSLDEFKEKIQSIVDALDLPVLVMAAVEDDIFRKPRPGMWELLLQRAALAKVEIERERCFFTGDAAGRAVSAGDGKKKKDFSASDYHFALNIGVKFRTPEEVFLHALVQPTLDVGCTLYPAQFNQPTPANNKTGVWDFEGHFSQAPSQCQPVMILVVGAPASGKSHFAQQIVAIAQKHGHDIAYVNMDSQSKASCLRTVQTAVEAGQSVIVDNTNSSVRNRNDYLSLCPEASSSHNYGKHALIIESDLDRCRHLNTFRRLTGGRHVPTVAMHTYFKRLELPTEEEGFHSVSTITWPWKWEDSDQVVQQGPVNIPASTLLTSYLF